MKRTLSILFLLAIAVATFFPTAAMAATNPDRIETVEGLAACSSNAEMPTARDKAVKDALRVAIEKVVGVLVSSETYVKNFQTIKDEILTNSEGYVKTYDIVDERFDPKDEILHVKVKVTIGELNMNDLTNQLIRLKILSGEGMPRIMVVIPEIHIARPAPDPAGETEIIRRLLDMNFKVVDQNQIKKIRDSEQVREAFDDREKAALLAQRFGADIIIIGEAFSETFNDNSVGFQLAGVGCTARIEARVIRTDTAEIIATNNLGLPTAVRGATELVAAKEALKKVGGQMADYLIPEIFKKFANPKKSFQIFVTGVDFDAASDLEDAIKNIKGVSSTYLRDFNEKSTSVTIDIEAAIATMDLAKELKKLQLKGLKIKVTNVTARRIDLKISK